MEGVYTFWAHKQIYHNINIQFGLNKFVQAICTYTFAMTTLVYIIGPDTTVDLTRKSIGDCLTCSGTTLTSEGSGVLTKWSISRNIVCLNTDARVYNLQLCTFLWFCRVTRACHELIMYIKQCWITLPLSSCWQSQFTSWKGANPT